MIYIGEIYNKQGKVIGPIAGSKEEVLYALDATKSYIKRDYDDSESKVECSNIVSYGFKKIARLFKGKEWKILLSNAIEREKLRKRRRKQLRS